MTKKYDKDFPILWKVFIFLLYIVYNFFEMVYNVQNSAVFCTEKVNDKGKRKMIACM